MIDLRDYGYRGELEFEGGLIPARITAVHRQLSRAVCEHGELDCALSGAYHRGVLERADLPAVGDYVLIRHNAQGHSLIERLLPRSSKFSRQDDFGHSSRYQKLSFEQVVAANFDYVFIMSSLNRDFNPNRIQRYLTAAWQSGGTPVVVLTKADLCPERDAQLAQVNAVAVGADVLTVSSLTGEGLDALRPYLRPGVTAVFLGSSGVGKSTLLNALAGEDLMKVSAIREDDARGRHTTTHRQLIQLPSGALVIDTPGMRELGLTDMDEGASKAFSDVEALFGRCRFSDCGHGAEPGCAVQQALRDGSPDAARWQQYQAQKREMAYAADRTKYARERTEKHKSISRQMRQNPTPKT